MGRGTKEPQGILRHRKQVNSTRKGDGNGRALEISCPPPVAHRGEGSHLAALYMPAVSLCLCSGFCHCTQPPNGRWLTVHSFQIKSLWTASVPLSTERGSIPRLSAYGKLHPVQCHSLIQSAVTRGKDLELPNSCEGQSFNRGHGRRWG